MRAGRWKAVFGGGLEASLFDLSVDPSESIDRSAEGPLEELRGYRQSSIDGTPALLDDVDVEGLKALGYLDD